jgi:putative restriction endonuclease
MSGGVVDLDTRIRAETFEFLRQQTAVHGEVLPWSVLFHSFTVDGERVPLIGPKGIWRPAVLPEMPLTFNTAPPKAGGAQPPYHDELGPDGLLRYRYRGTDPNHPDNVGMRLAMRRQVPLVYLFGIVKGEYLPIWPVYIVGDDPAALTFQVAVDDTRFAAAETATFGEEIKRAYVARVVMYRLHQESFRRRVLRAYRDRCSMCQLRHTELLEAAHILPDGHPLGEPIVANGLSLCTLHHAAFDRHILGVTPDLIVRVRPDILEEIDGPMLQHGLKEMEGRRLAVIPGSQDLQPRREFLEERFGIFRRAG